ncbi:putative CRM1-nuclear export factor, exportin [Atractiella rhizophila]|nr:putative CRM1-nuclear export factor, exportin [Atractiella rhizophila]
MDAILDFSQPLSVPLLDQVVYAFFTGKTAERSEAQRVITSFQENPDSWQRVPQILEESNSFQTKYVALQIMEKLIGTRWKVLPPDQQAGIRNWVVATVVKLSEDETILRKEKSFMNKLNMILVAILKQTWPHSWPTFIPELVASSRTNLTICENNLTILKLLSEEIFDFSAQQLTRNRTKSMQIQIQKEFKDVFDLCEEIVANGEKPSLIQATLEALHRFMGWMPESYIFNTSLVTNLINRFLTSNQFRNISLKCLSQINSLELDHTYDIKFFQLFEMVMEVINNVIPLTDADFVVLYENASTAEQDLIMNLTSFLTYFLNWHGAVLENTSFPNSEPLFFNAYSYLLKITLIDERETFKMALEFWAKLTKEIYEEHISQPASALGTIVNEMVQDGSLEGTAFGDLLGPRERKFKDILSTLRRTMIQTMVKPEEVLVVENDEGEIVREHMKEVDIIVIYKTMKEILVYLTNIDGRDTETIMTHKLTRQVDGSEWGWTPLNRLCWAIGSISGAMNEDSEKRFLVQVIKDLLNLCEMKRGKDNKAVVASNIMYIVGQYPRFLKAHWKFLKTVVNKNFEFMHERHEGVQDMACDTFLKIAQKCKRYFVTVQPNETHPFIEEIIQNLPDITSDLSPLQVHTFYEACGHMIYCTLNPDHKEQFLLGLMQLPNSFWTSMVQQAKNSIEVFNESENVKLIVNVIRTNVAIVNSAGGAYAPQLKFIQEDILAMYKTVSGIINESIAKDGMIATKTPKVRGLRSIKKETLKLFEKYVKRSEDLTENNVSLIPPLFDAILGDYNTNIPDAREADVLLVTATCVAKMGPLMNDKIAPVLDAVFDCTLDMINKEFANFPEHRVQFFHLLRAIDTSCFPALLALPPERFKLFILSIVWAMKHYRGDIGNVGMNIAYELLNNVAQTDPAVASGFFQQYLLAMIEDVFVVMTDVDHRSGFKYQTNLLARIFGLVQEGAIQAPLFDPATQPPSMDNVTYVGQFTVDLLTKAFPNMQSSQIQTYVSRLFELHNDHIAFKLATRDFLIQIREFQGKEDGDHTDLFQDEKEEEKKKQEEEARQKNLAIPGMVKPSEQVEMDEEL